MSSYVSPKRQLTFPLFVPQNCEVFTDFLTQLKNLSSNLVTAHLYDKATPNLFLFSALNLRKFTVCVTVLITCSIFRTSPHSSICFFNHILPISPLFHHTSLVIHLFWVQTSLFQGQFQLHFTGF